MKKIVQYISLLLVLAQSLCNAADVQTAKSATDIVQEVFKSSRSTKPLANFNLNLNYSSTEDTQMTLGESYHLPLPSGKHKLSLQYQQYGSLPSSLSVTLDGERTMENKVVDTGIYPTGYFRAPSNIYALEGDFTVYVKFNAKADGTLFMRHDTSGKWKPKGKVLGIKKGKLMYDVGGLGSISTDKKVTDGKVHYAVVRSHKKEIQLFLDGKLIGVGKKLAIDDQKDSLFQIGHGSNFSKDLNNGVVSNVRFWKRSITDIELKDLGAGAADKVNTPDQVWSPPVLPKAKASEWLPGLAIAVIIPNENFTVHSATIQPLDLTAHAQIIKSLNSKSLNEGKRIYSTLCITCHGDRQKPGSLPTALKFHQGVFKNGTDPYRMFKTLEKGYGMMVPQAQYTSEQKYAVIQYVRETFLKEHNPTQYAKVDSSYLKSLPKGLHLPKQIKPRNTNRKPYLEMDFGPYMMGSFQIDKHRENIAQKGIMVRLDKGTGGVSKGNSWILYDHDTMRVATAYQGDFINWRSILYDGSHGTHVSITGDPVLTVANQPIWQNPNTGDWKDLRIKGRDGRRYGPLPKSWVNYKGLYVNNNKVIISYTVGDTEIKELPSLSGDDTFVRQLYVGKRKKPLVCLLGKKSDTLNFAINAPQGVQLKENDGATYLHIPKGDKPLSITLGFANLPSAQIVSKLPPSVNIPSLCLGGPSMFPKVIETSGNKATGDSPFLVDELTVPSPNIIPGNVWIRLGGFDFFQNNPDRAAVCTWQGDVWLVDGVQGDLKKLQWRRIATGLFQPLGLKIVKNTIYVTCRDQIARLHDLNGDEEIDFVESFNHDHQVTEHFHEFAMGLQTDSDGNFYYAKSARHAKTAVVPHHGTLLMVPPDGSRTEIIANGFRAANGVCLNPDGTWIVTDQEGHWNPKNRINYVKKGGFYGNMYGYHDVTDSSDEAMEKPLCWVTNSFDRSPAELVWVPKDAAWGGLNGTLLNLSYGYGKIYTVPHEIVDGQAQGGMCALPIAQTPSGIHRGRFHPKNKQLYGVGMFAWAGTQRADAGFYRIRYTGRPAKMPIATEVKKGSYTLTFSDPIPQGSTFKVKSWDLKRTKNYGSKHYNEKEIQVTNVEIKGPKVLLTIPTLKVTRGLEILCTFPDKSTRKIHATINVVR